MNKKYAGSFHLKPAFLFVKYCQETLSKNSHVCTYLLININEASLRTENMLVVFRKPPQRTAVTLYPDSIPPSDRRWLLVAYGRQILPMLACQPLLRLDSLYFANVGPTVDFYSEWW